MLTNYGELAATDAGRSRNHGGDAKYQHPVIGLQQSRLDTLQAVVLSAKLRAAGRRGTRRAARPPRRYDELLAGLHDVVAARGRCRATSTSGTSTWSASPPRRVLKKLHAAGIGAGIHYPVPDPPHRALRPGLGYAEGAFPVAEQAAGELLSLPLFAEITAGQQEQVALALKSALR